VDRDLPELGVNQPLRFICEDGAPDLMRGPLLIVSPLRNCGHTELPPDPEHL
jgi:hypothetical protein